MVLLKASTEGDFEPALVSAVRQRADALLVSANPFFTGRVPNLSRSRHAMPCPQVIRGENIPTLVGW